MGQGRDLFAQNATVIFDVSGADFQQIVEGARNHVAHLYLGDLVDGLVEGGQGGLAGVGQLGLQRLHALLGHAQRLEHELVSLRRGGITVSSGVARTDDRGQLRFVGLFAGLISFIPFVGSILGGVLSIGIALFHFWNDPIWIAVTTEDGHQAWSSPIYLFDGTTR